MSLSAGRTAMACDFSMRRMVQFAETDSAGVMHFAQYPRIMEEVEHAYWRSLGMSVLSREGDMALGWPRVAVSCEYFNPVRFEDELDLELTLTKVGDKSLSYQVAFLCGGRRVALGAVTAVCCASIEGSFVPTPIPESIRSKLPRRGGAPG